MNGTLERAATANITALSGAAPAPIHETRPPRLPVPKVECVRKGERLVVVCPFCDRKHYHGARGGLGLRVSDCRAMRCYELVAKRS